MTKEKATSDPFPDLPRRSLYVPLDHKAVVIDPAEVRRAVAREAMGRAGPGPEREVMPVAEHKPSVEARPAVTDGVAAGRKRGRPSLGKPWEAEGISRSAYFERKTKLKGTAK